MTTTPSLSPLQLGQINRLQIQRKTEFGLYLTDSEGQEILLPRRFIPKIYEFGDLIDVFIHHDSENRLTATTEKPKAMVGQFCSLTVVATERIGAFLNWGLGKDLLLATSEQTDRLRVGDNVAVYIYIDHTDRIAATMRLDKYTSKEPANFQEGQEIDALLVSKTDLGFKALTLDGHWGILYFNEVFKDLYLGDALKVFVKKVRPDGKLDFSLQKAGYEASADIAPLILEKLKDNKGFLEINDKTSAEIIYEMFGVSKKKYKMALGGLYKQRLITVSDDGIRLV